jgi:hypothetical protein
MRVQGLDQRPRDTLELHNKGVSFLFDLGCFTFFLLFFFILSFGFFVWGGIYRLPVFFVANDGIGTACDSQNFNMLRQAYVT